VFKAFRKLNDDNDNDVKNMEDIENVNNSGGHNDEDEGIYFFRQNFVLPGGPNGL
jgi:hypothetical protein